MFRVLGSISTAVLLAGCAQSWFVLGSSRSTIDGRTERATIRVQAFDGSGAPAGGTVELEATAGELVEGPVLELRDGFGTRTFRCDPVADDRCRGPVSIRARWEGQSSDVVVTLRDAPAALEPFRFAVVPTMSTAALADLATDGHTLWAAGAAGTVLVHRGASWETVPSGTTADLRAIAVGPSGLVAVVGANGTVVRLEPGGPVTVPAGLTEELTAVTYTTDGALFVASASGQVFRAEADGLRLELSLGPRVGQLLHRDGVVWAVGEGAMASREPGGEWLRQSCPELALGVRAALDGDALFLGGSRRDGLGGWLLSWPIGAPAWATTPTEVAVADVVMSPSGRRLALASGTLLVDDGGAWASMHVPAEGTAAVSRSEDDLVIVGPPGISLFRVP